MSGTTEFSLIGGGAVAGLCLLSAGILLLTKPWERRAVAFARQWRLPLTPEVTVRIAQRLRTQVLVSFVAIGVIAGPVIVLLPYLIRVGGWGTSLVTASTDGFIGIWLILPIAEVVGHSADAAITGRRSGRRVARLVPAEMTDFTPPVLIWMIRATWLLPLLATLIWLGVPVGASSPAWPHRFSIAVVAIAVSAPVIGLLVEAWQRRIIRGPQRASSGLELAFDDAFRTAAVHHLALVGVWVASFAMNVVSAPALLAAHRSFGVFLAVGFAPVIIGVAIQIALVTPWSRQRFRSRLAPPSMVLSPPPSAASGDSIVPSAA